MEVCDSLITNPAGAFCSKLMMLLVNVYLKFQQMITLQILGYVLLENVRIFFNASMSVNN